MKYILFDLDGTLMDFHEGERKAFIDTIVHFTAYVPSEEECSLFSGINERLFNEFAKGKMKRIEFQEKRFEEISDYLHLTLDVKTTNQYYIESLKYQADLYPDVLDILTYLYPKYELYIASNGMSSVQKKRLSIAGINHFFKDFFISEEAGYNKPDVRFFDYVFEKIGDENKDEYLIIGDRYDTDVQGGLDAGIHAIYLSRNEKKDDSIRNLEELKSIL